MVRPCDYTNLVEVFFIFHEFGRGDLLKCEFMHQKEIGSQVYPVSIRVKGVISLVAMETSPHIIKIFLGNKGGGRGMRSTSGVGAYCGINNFAKVST